MKTCTLCKADKALDEFSPHRTGRHGRAAWCRPCMAQKARDRLARLDRDAHNQHRRERNAELRRRAEDALGGACARCGMDDRRVLEIDHVHGGGNREQRQLGWPKIYRKIAEVSTDGYQLLCANCHLLKTRGF